jgi:serine protease 16
LVSFLGNISNFGNPYAPGQRQWFFQTCSENGWYPTDEANKGKQPFGYGISTAFYLQFCRDIFLGLRDLPDVNELNAIFGGKTPVGSQVVFVTGTLEPGLGVMVTQSLPDMPAIVIEGASHCQDMHPALPNDPPGLAKAQAQVLALVRAWIK